LIGLEEEVFINGGNREDREIQTVRNAGVLPQRPIDQRI
jgi:hypothetical protein